MNQPSAGNAPIPQPTSKRQSKLVIMISVVVAVVIIGAAFGTYYVVSHNNNTRYHVGNASVAQVDNLAGKNLSKHYDNNSNSSEVAMHMILLNETTNGVSSASILILSEEFQTTSQATNNYNGIYDLSLKSNSTHNITEKNGTYGGFNYFTIGYSEQFFGTTFYIFLAVGHADQFMFEIVDNFVPLTNSTILLHDEINAMS